MRRFVLGKDMIKRLILAGSGVLRDRFPPFVCIAELRVDIENNAAERE
jgi:hypothetical protein